MASLVTLPAIAFSNPATASGAVRLRAAAFRCWALRRRGWAAAGALASPNSVLSEHAFKRLQLGSDDEDEEGPYGSDADEGFQGDEEELAIARLGLPDELVATLEKRGITHLFPIQVNEPLRRLSLSLCGCGERVKGERGMEALVSSDSDDVETRVEARGWKRWLADTYTLHCLAAICSYLCFPAAI